MHVFVSGFSEDFRAGDLFSEEKVWFAGSDEIGKLWSEVSFIFTAFLTTGYREWLARGRSGPERNIDRHTSEPQRIGPSGDPGEKMTLGKTLHVIRCDFENGSAVDLVGRDVPLLHQLRDPSTG